MGLYTHTHTHTHTGNLQNEINNKIGYTEKGITIVALVITIIILLILAGISIQGLTHTGMFESAYKAKLEAKRGQIEEWLTLKVIEEQANYPTEKADKIIPKVREDVIENISELQKIGKVEEKDVTETSTEENFKAVDIYFYVTVDEDIYKVDLKEQKFIGQVGKMVPAIRLDNISSETSEITVKVSTQNNEGGKLEYYIKSEDENSYTKKDTLDSEINQEYTYKGLMQNKKYSIKIVAESKGKQTAQVFGEASTGNIEVATGGTYTPTTWTNGKVIVTLPTKSGYETRYTTDKTIPTASSAKYTNEFEVSKNTMINYAFSDGTNVGKVGTLNVINIDTVGPVIETIRSAVSSAISTEAKLSTTVNDVNSGLSKIVWQWGTTTSFGSSKTDTYTEMNGSTTGTKESITATCELKGLSAGTKYYARVIVYDVAGNPKTSSTIEFTTGAGVAQVGDTIYTSVQNAVNAISSSSATEIKLLVNRKESITIPSGKKISFNLNGKTLSYNGTIIKNYGTLTLNGGNIQTTGNNIQSIINSGELYLYSANILGNDGWTLNNIGTFYMFGGSITSKSTNNGAAVINFGNFYMSSGKIEGDENGIATRGGNTNISGGTIVSNASSSSGAWAFIVDSKGTAIIQNATITGGRAAILTNKKDSADDHVGKSLIIIDSTINGIVGGNVIRISGRTGGYSIYYYDTYQEYNSITFPTWTNNNGQDDLVWHNAKSGTLNNSKVWYYDILKSDRT